MDILSVFFPKWCVGCGRIGTYICQQCASRINHYDSVHQRCPYCGKLSVMGMTHVRCKRRYGLDGTIAFFKYDGVIQGLVKHVKYRRAYRCLDSVHSLIRPNMIAAIQLLYPGVTKACLVVPLHPKRQQERGFNQSVILGELFSKKLSFPLYSSTVVRTVHTPAQAFLQHSIDRQRNVRNVFALQGDLPKVHLGFIVDDVYTTGATVQECAKILKKQGMQYVWGLTLAR